MVFEEAVVTHGIEATCASPNGIEAKCASPRWRPNPEIDWHRDRHPRDMINPAGRNHVNRQRSPSSNATNICKIYIQNIYIQIYIQYTYKIVQAWRNKPGNSVHERNLANYVRSS